MCSSHVFVVHRGCKQKQAYTTGTGLNLNLKVVRLNMSLGASNYIIF